MRRLLQLATLIICLPLIYFAASLLGALWPGAQAELPDGAEIEILLARGPAHYDLLLPLTPKLRTDYGFAEARGVPIRNPFARWLLIGWGAAGYYTDPDQTEGLSGLRPTLLWQVAKGDDAVLYVAVVGDVDRIEGLDRLRLSLPQYAALLDGVAGTFLRDQTGAPLALEGGGVAGRDAVFAARGRFTLFHTANDWIGETLLSAGVPFGIWTPTPQSVALALAWRRLS